MNLGHQESPRYLFHGAKGKRPAPPVRRAGLIGLTVGYQVLPDAIRNACDEYYNDDVTGDTPIYQTVGEIAAHTRALAERSVIQAGGATRRGVTLVPSQ